MSDMDDKELKKEAIAIVSEMAKYLSISTIRSMGKGELSKLKDNIAGKRQFLYGALLRAGPMETETRRYLEHALRVVGLVSLLIAIAEAEEMEDGLKKELDIILKDLRHGPGPIVEIFEKERIF